MSHGKGPYSQASGADRGRRRHNRRAGGAAIVPAAEATTLVATRVLATATTSLCLRLSMATRAPVATHPRLHTLATTRVATHAVPRATTLSSRAGGRASNGASNSAHTSTIGEAGRGAGNKIGCCRDYQYQIGATGQVDMPHFRLVG